MTILKIIAKITIALACLAMLQTPCNGHAELSGIGSIATGGNHTCALTTTGGVKCWGYNNDGQLGDGSWLESSTTAVDVTGLSSGITIITAGRSYTCALTTAGGLKCWGSNNYGQLGDGSTSDRTTAVNVTGLTSGIADISAGIYHTCAITTAGGLKCWGRNLNGQLGDGSVTQRTTAVGVIGLSLGIAKVTIGVNHTCALTTAGGVKCWGKNDYGQLGDGSLTNRTTAVDVTGLSSGIANVSSGDSHACALTTSGGLKCWGRNDTGQLGDGSTTNRMTAVDITGLLWGIADVTAEGSHSCAVTTTGGLKCWGSNNFGQLGDGSTTTRTTAIDVTGLSSGIANATAGGSHTCALTTTGGLRCWGSNHSGQLGDGSTTQRTTAVDVTGLSSGIADVTFGSSHTCALTTAGGLKCWGVNSYGQVGDGSTTNSSIAVDVTGLSSGIADFTLGDSHTCVLTTTGGLKCWGYNSNGQLGDGSTTNRTTAVDVTGLLSGIADVTAGNYHTCALTTAGGLKCWGYNSNGQLGDGSTTQRTTAVDVTGLLSGIADVTAGGYHTCAVTTTVGLKCWGRNDFGQLGDGSTTQRTTAVDVTELSSGIGGVAAGTAHTCTLTTTGGLKCWGQNNSGQLGDGSITSRSTAVDVMGLASGIGGVAAGSAHTCAITTTGAVKCWGWNDFGQLGDGSTTQRTTAVDVTELSSGIGGVAAGSAHTCAITTTGGLKCWGSNNTGQLGEAPYIRTVLRGMRAQGVVTLSGSPLSGVVFRATGMGPLYATQESTADGSGAYLLPIVETASYVITPELAGYTFSPVSITGTMSSDLTQDFVATLITYNITGTVTANAQPLIGASVDGGGLGTATTNASGVYAFNGITPGTAYSLTVSHSGATFGVDTASGTLNSHATHDFSGTLNTYDITGTITAGGNPLAGVSVSGGGLGNTTTDGSGDYSFTGVNYGTAYVITPSLTDYNLTPTSAGATLTGNATHDFTGVYNPPTTTVVTTTSVATTTAATTSVTTSTIGTSTVATSTTVETTSTLSVPTTVGSTTTSQATTTAPSTTTAQATSTIATSTAPQDSDGDGLTDTEEETHGTDPEVADSDRDGVTDGEEVTTGTNPKDPGSKAPKLRTTICSDWNGYLGGSSGRGMYNIMEHVNLTTKKLRVKTELRSIRGHLKDTFEFFLRGNQQFDILVHDFSGREANSYGQVCTTYERAPAGSLDGRMVYYKFGNTSQNAGGNASQIQFAFALPFENPSIGTSALMYNTAQPSLDPHDSGNLVANWVQLSNVSKKRLKGRLYFHRPDGTQLTKPVDVNLRDGARYDYSAHGYGANLTGLIRFVPTDKTVDYQLREVRYLYDNPGTEDSFASAYPFGAQVGSGETLIAPVDATSSSAVLELGNMGAVKVNALVKLYDKTGKKLQYSKTHALKAYGTEHILLDGHLGNAQGVAVVKASAAKASTTKGSGTKTTATTTGTLLGQVVHYGRTTTGGVQNMHAMPLAEPVGKSIRGSYNTYLNQGCTLYLANTSTAMEKVTVSLKQGDGTIPIGDYKLSVPGRGLLAEDICSKSPANVYGVVTVTATHAKHIYGAVVRRGDSGAYQMGTVLR